MRTGHADSPSVSRQPPAGRSHYWPRQGIWLIVACYLSLGLLWIIGGDWLMTRFMPGRQRSSVSQLASNAMFLVATAIVLLLLLRARVRSALRVRLQLASAEASRSALFQANPNPMLVYDLNDLHVIEANLAAAAFFGWPSDQLIGLDVQQLWPPSTELRLHRGLEKTDDGADPVQVMDGPMQCRDGSLRVVQARSNALDHRGTVAGLLVINDRNAEHDAQMRRDQALQRLEEAQAIAQLGSWELDPASGLGRYSRQVYRMLGRPIPPDDRRHHGFEALLASFDTGTQAHLCQVLRDMQGEAPVELDMLVPITDADGRQRTLHLRAGSTRDDNVPCIRGTLQDVTEHESSRRLLREREEQFRELVRVLPDGVVILDQELVLYINAACAGQFGCAPESLLGEALHDLVLEEDLERVRDQLQASHQRSEPGITVRMQRRDGVLFQAGLSFGDVRYSGRNCKLLLVRDLSEPERMRDALALSNGELHAMARRLFSLQEDERRAISRDLHDDIGQAITAMKLSAHAALEETDAQRRQEDLQEIISLADGSMTKLRNLSMLLRPPQLDALGLEAALRWQASMLFRASAVHLQMERPAASLPAEWRGRTGVLPDRAGRPDQRPAARLCRTGATGVAR
ncbi:PAS domain S-box protein [Pseudoxanthomonas sp.]|uniref:PAS domain-containing sensor histidine kinase n=1 Tax=Pseudoxanthomonas sp. TaxID=1871049 RepID=UPI0031F31C1D